MSEIICDGSAEPIDITSRHKLERKELQAKIQNLKHSIAKGDKKKKREVTEQIAKLEAELDLRHEQELQEVSQKNGHIDRGADLSDDLRNLSTHDDKDNSLSTNPNQPKPSKAKKRREKKAEQDRERSQRISEQDKLNVTGARNVEAQKIKAILNNRNLSIYDIPSNGDCLYAAVCHQLELLGISETVQSVRRQTAQLMREKADEFLPFLCDPDSGDLYTEEKYEKYCDDIENTTTWGGQLELQAASQFLSRPIEVIQGEGPIILVGENFTNAPLKITYHRHSYGLGEHYNSTIDKIAESTEDEFS